MEQITFNRRCMPAGSQCGKCPHKMNSHVIQTMIGGKTVTATCCVSGCRCDGEWCADCIPGVDF